MSSVSQSRPALSTRMLLAGLATATVAPIYAQEISFGELQLFEFDTFAQETRYGWSSGNALVTDINLSTSIGTITGSRDAQITPAVEAWGVTIIPEIRADTRSGARLTSTFQGKTGVELNAGLTVGGAGFNAAIEAGPTLLGPGQVNPGQFFNLKGGSTLGSNSTFDPGLPKLDAGLDIVLQGDFNNKFEYGLFPVAKYSVGNFGFDFDLGFNLFDFNLDLNLPELPSINFPDLPNFTIPPDVDENTLLRQKLPPSNPALSIGELAIDNPLKSISTEFDLTADGRLTSSTSGSITRAGLDIDGIASALATGVSFTGTSAKIGPGKIGYDLIDVKYGLELGVEYDTEIDTFINATLTFDKAVLQRNEDGSTQEVTSYTGRWDELPEFALLTREDVSVDVDFENIEAIFSHTGGLTLSDYMELQALSAEVKVGPLKLVDLGPVVYKKFPLAGELASFELFDASFSLGMIELPDNVWDGTFIIEKTPDIDIALANNTDVLNSAIRVVETGTTATFGEDKNLIIGLREAGDTTRDDLTPTTYTDAGATKTATLRTWYDLILPGLNVFVGRDSVSATVEIRDPDAVTVLNELIVPEGSRYRLERGGVRNFELNRIENNGVINADGLLGFQAGLTGTLEIEGDGSMAFIAPGSIVAETLIHGEGHAMLFLGFDPFIPTIGPDEEDFPDFPATTGSLRNEFDRYEWVGVDSNYIPQSPTDNPPIRQAFVFDVGTLDNSGFILFRGGYDRGQAAFQIDQLINRSTGTIQVTDGVAAQLGTPDVAATLVNEGRIIVAENASQLFMHYDRVEANAGEQGEFIVGTRDAFMSFDGGDAGTTFVNQSFTNAGLMVFENRATFDGQTDLLNQSTGTIHFTQGFSVTDTTDVAFINHGTMNIEATSSLIATDSGGSTTPLNLVNTGTVNVTNDAIFSFGMVIDSFTDGGATFESGTWNIIGQAGDISNLDPLTGTSGAPSPAGIDLQVLGVDAEDGAFFDILGGTAQLNTALKVNAANVTLSGQALFPYFNTVEINRGNITFANGHQFTTAKQYVNDGGTTTIQQGGDLFVQGALKVFGGSVDVDAQSTLTALTQTEVIDDEGNTRDVTVEVIGGTLNIASSDYLTNTNMFFDRADLTPEFNYIGLEAGQVWIVREQVLIDPETQVETTTGAQINLGNAAIERNDGTIIIDGSNARFDAAERMRYNHGTLILQGGFEFNTLVDEFQNANGASLTLEAANFIVTGSDGTFQNDGQLVMDGDSYLFTGHFVNGPSASLQLDGILDASMVTINAGSTITGSGIITGSIINNGTLDLGNSPGLIQSFGSFTQGAGGDSLFEIQGYEAGTTYDQLVVIQVEPVAGEETQPEIFVTVDGTLSLAFDESLPGRYGFEWVLIDNQGDNAIIGQFDPIDVSGLTAGDPLNTNGVDTTGDIYLGDLGEFALFLTYAGGDGNDLTVYAVPEPSSLALIGFGGLALLRRRRRHGVSA